MGRMHWQLMRSAFHRKFNGLTYLFTSVSVPVVSDLGVYGFKKSKQRGKGTQNTKSLKAAVASLTDCFTLPSHLHRPPCVSSLQSLLCSWWRNGTQPVSGAPKPVSNKSASLSFDWRKPLQTATHGLQLAQLNKCRKRWVNCSQAQGAPLASAWSSCSCLTVSACGAQAGTKAKDHDGTSLPHISAHAIFPATGTAWMVAICNCAGEPVTAAMQDCLSFLKAAPQGSTMHLPVASTRKAFSDATLNTARCGEYIVGLEGSQRDMQ